MAVSRTFNFGISLCMTGAVFLAGISGLSIWVEDGWRALFTLALTLVTLSIAMVLSGKTEAYRVQLHDDGTVEFITLLRRYRMPMSQVLGIGQLIGAIVYTMQGSFLVFTFNDATATEFLAMMKARGVPVSTDSYDLPGRSYADL